MKKAFCFSVACLIAFAASAEPRTWTFSKDGRINVKGGAVSFAKGGSIEADFLRVDNTDVVLKLAIGGDGSVALDSLSDADRTYVAQMRGVPVDVARLEQEAAEREARNRLQVQVIAKEKAMRKAEEMRQAEERKQEETIAATARLARFQPLLKGKPAPMTQEYYDAWVAIKDVAEHSRDPVFSSEAREILKLAKEIDKFRLQGATKELIEYRGKMIVQRLNRLLDRGVLSP